jgi:hypothetical protein
MKDSGSLKTLRRKILGIIFDRKWLIIGTVVISAGIIILSYAGEIKDPFLSKLLETIGIGLVPTGAFFLVYEFGIKK